MAKVNHSFTSPKADGADATLVRPSSWNADHTITNLIKKKEVDFGATQTWYGYFTVSDADVTGSSKVVAWLSGYPPAATRDGVTADGDEAEMEQMNVVVQNTQAGTFDISVEVIDGPVDGPYVFHYITE